MNNSIPWATPEQGVTVFKHASGGCITLNGADVLEWLQRTVTADVRRQIGRVCRSLCLDRLGRIRAEVLCFLGSQPVALAVIGGQRDQLITHLTQHVIMEDVEINLCDGTLYSVHGASTGAAIARLKDIPGVRFGDLSWLTQADLAVLVPNGSEPVWQQALAALAFQQGSGRDWDSRRIEMGLPTYGKDYDAQDTPSVAGLAEGLISQTKGCYLGQEVVCKTLMRGTVREQAVRIRFETQPQEGAEVQLAETGIPIGRLTSVAERARSGEAWAIGRVRSSAIETCAQVTATGIKGQILPR